MATATVIKKAMPSNSNNDSIATYLQEIGRIDLLTAEQEIELGRAIAQLIKLESDREVLAEQKGRTPTDLEWADAVNLSPLQLRGQLTKGRSAKNKLVTANLRLVASVAKKYINRGLSFQDLIQEGSIGLIRAAEKFDYQKGRRFSTYATWWINAAMKRGLTNNSRTIRLPNYIVNKIYKIKTARNLLSQKLGRKPTVTEIATEIDLPVAKLRAILKSSRSLSSLDLSVGSLSGSNLCELIRDANHCIANQLENNCLLEDINKSLSRLTAIEAEILRLRYGLDGEKAKDYKQIAKIMSYSRTQIKRKETRALQKLRARDRFCLKEYLA